MMCALTGIFPGNSQKNLGNIGTVYFLYVTEKVKLRVREFEMTCPNHRTN